MRTKWQILQDKLEAARGQVAYLEHTITALEATPTQHIDGGPMWCSNCKTAMWSEADFAKHFLIPDEQFLNLGECPYRTPAE